VENQLKMRLFCDRTKKDFLREPLPLQGLGQGLLQVGGGCREGELDCNAAAVVEDGGEVVPFRGGQDGELVVGLTCRRHGNIKGHYPVRAARLFSPNHGSEERRSQLNAP